MFEFIETCSENGPVSVKLCHLSKLIGCNIRQEQSISKVSGLNDHNVANISSQLKNKLG